MKKLLSKTLLALAIVSFTSIVMAECGTCCEPACPPPPKPKCEPCRTCEICPPCEPCKPCCTEVPTIGEPCNCAYNAPARIDPACGWDAWISLSFLYWQPKEKGLDLGNFNSVPITLTQSATARISGQVEYDNDLIKMDFDYHPAFKLGLGFSSDRDDWTLYFEYTRFYSKDNRSIDLTNSLVLNNIALIGASIAEEFLSTNWINESISDSEKTILGATPIPGTLGLGPVQFAFFHSRWELKTNIVDMELGRPYYLGRKLIFKPYYGLRGGTIDQKYSFTAQMVDYAHPDNFLLSYSKNKVDTWLIGPRIGVDTDWLIGCHFRIFGNVAAALTYQKFKTRLEQILPVQKNGTISVTDSTAITYKSKSSTSYLTPEAELELGLGYGTYFCNNEWYFDLTAGYSFNYFWHQNMMRNLSDGFSRLIDSHVGDLMLHGLTVTARLDF
jgi:hypothetical protein